jgi:hypothetical protein
MPLQLQQYKSAHTAVHKEKIVQIFDKNVASSLDHKADTTSSAGCIKGRLNDKNIIGGSDNEVP